MWSFSLNLTVFVFYIIKTVVLICFNHVLRENGNFLAKMLPNKICLEMFWQVTPVIIKKKTEKKNNCKSIIDNKNKSMENQIYQKKKKQLKIHIWALKQEINVEYEKFLTNNRNCYRILVRKLTFQLKCEYYASVYVACVR